MLHSSVVLRLLAVTQLVILEFLYHTFGGYIAVLYATYLSPCNMLHNTDTLLFDGVL